MLQILVAKVINASIVEITKENEIIASQNKQREIDAKRNAEIIKTIRINNKNRRYEQEMTYRQREQVQREALRKHKMTKNYCISTSHKLIVGLLQTSFVELKQRSLIGLDPILQVNDLFNKNYEQSILENFQQINHIDNLTNSIFNKKLK